MEFITNDLILRTVTDNDIEAFNDCSCIKTENAN